MPEWGQLRPPEWSAAIGAVGRVRKHATLEARRHGLTQRNSARNDRLSANAAVRCHECIAVRGCARGMERMCSAT